MAKRRQLDGTFRSAQRPSKISPRTLHARWLEEEVLKLKILGVSTFGAIAVQVSKVGRGEAQPVSEIPDGMLFPGNYSISSVACYKACQRALARGPRLRAQELRDIDSDRLEEAILASQKGVKQGDPQAVQNLARLISVRARLNGYMLPNKIELSGKAGGPLEVKQTNDEEFEQMLDRLTPDEQIEFLRLYNKARGVFGEKSTAADGGENADGRKGETTEEADQRTQSESITGNDPGPETTGS